MKSPVLGSRNMPCALPKSGTLGAEGPILGVGVGVVSADGVWFIFGGLKDVGDGV